VIKLTCLVIALALAAGCKKKSASTNETLDRMIELTNRMCACQDKPCADAVSDEMTRWSVDVGRAANAGDQRPSEAQLKEMGELAERFGACMTAALQRDKPVTPAVQADSRDADLLLASAFNDVIKTGPLTDVTVSFVTADGKLDPTYGKIALSTGKRTSQPVDDPKRPIGAPVPPVTDTPTPGATECKEVTIENGHREVTDSALCIELPTLARPRCRIHEVWRQSIAAGAPAKALAIIKLAQGEKTQVWRLTVEDEPRGIHFSHDVSDTCAPVVEKP
jgi:hypothetical protein